MCDATTPIVAVAATPTVVVTVNADNDAPTAEAGTNQFIHEGTVVTLTGSGEDPENTALSYAWTQTGGSPTVTLTGGTTTTATFTAPELVEDVTLTFTLTVTDAGGASGTDTVAIRVWANNDAPTAAAGSDQTVSEGDAVTLTGTGQDPEQSVLTYAWRQTGGSPTMTLTGAATATTTFTVPELTGPTTLTFTLTVTDAGGSPGTGKQSGTDVVVVTVNADNDLPTADAGTDQTVSEGDAVTLSGSGQDPENAALSYAWTQTGGSPTVTLTGATTTTPTFSLSELTGPTALTFQLTVTAGGASVTDEVVVTVNADNDAPTAEAGTNQFIHEGTVVTLTGSGEDPENTALSYAWTQTGGSPTVTLTGGTTTTATFTAPELVEDVTLTFTLTVTDAGGASGTDTVAIRVWANNDAPTAAAGSDQTVSEGDAVTLTGTGQDPEQSVLTYAWRQTGGSPTMTLTGAATATTTFTVPELTGPTTLTFTLTVTDAGGSPGTGKQSGTDVVVVTVNADNDLPTADAGTDQTVSEGDAVTLSGSGQDPENAALSYAWTQTGGSPTVTLTGATTTTPTFSLSELTGPTALTFQLTVTAGGASVTDEVVVTVNADNDAPTAEAGTNQFIHEGTVVTLTGSGEDPENTALSYAWTQTGGSPTVTLTGGTTTTATFTAPELVEDVTLTFTLTVTDAGGASGTDTVAIRVWANNDAPTAAAGSDQTVSEGDAVTLTGTGQDPEQSVLTYAWRQTGGSPTMTLTGAATATTTFTVPELTGPTTLTFTLTVTDAGGSPGTGKQSGTDVVVVTVNADNDLPTADAGTDQTVSEGDAVTLSGSGQDPENAALSYAWTQTGGSPTVTLTGATTTTPTFSLSELTGPTALTFQLTVTAGGASVTDEVVVTVNADNDAPTAEAGTNQFIHEGTVVTLTGSGEDPENTALSYAWTQTGGSPTVTLTGGTTTTATFTAPELVEDVTLTFTLTVTDAGGASGTDTVAIRVWANNDAPTAAAGSDQTVSEGDAVTLTGTGQDPEQSVLTYAWRQTGGSPTMTLTGAATATTTFTVPELTGPTTLTFTLTVTDAGGSPGTGKQSGTDVVVVTVNADNDLPTADAGTDQTVSEGDAVTLSGSGQDPENAALSYAWTQTGGSPTVTLTGATTTTPTFSLSELTGPTALTFQLTVTAGGASVTDEVVVTVNADNDAPTAEAGTNQFIHEGTVVTLTGSGEDPENTALSYAWTQTGGSPTVTLTGGTTTTATFTAPELVEDVTLTFTLTVTDAGGASGTDTVAIRVWANNDAPTAAAGSDQTVSEGDAVTLTGTGQDPEQSVLTYAWRQTGGSPTMTLTGAATATTTFTVPELTGPTTLTFTLTVTDAGGSPGTGKQSGTDVVVVTVNADNDLPTADAGTDQTVSEGDAVTLSGSGQDPENAALSYAWTQTGGSPTVTLTGATTTTATFTAPELSAETTLTFTLTVTAGGGSGTDTVAVTIQANNDAPTADAGTDQTVTEGDAVTLTGTGEDPEGGTLTYGWLQTGGLPGVTLSGGATTATVTFTAPELSAETTLTFTLTVTDAGGVSGSDTVAVTIQADNDPPTADAGADQTVPEGDAVTLSGRGEDPEGDMLSYAWTQTGGVPSVPLTGAATATPTFPAPELAADATLTFTLTVMAGGASATDTVAITVLTRSPGGEVRPTFGDTTIADQMWTQNTEIPVLTLPTATGGMGTVTYDLSPALPTGVTLAAESHVITGTPVVHGPPTIYTWRATDGTGATANLLFTITVAADLQPVFRDGVAAQRYRVGIAVRLTLPEATGGDGALRYALVPPLPAGLTVDASTRLLFGTPTAVQARTRYTWTVRDADGDADTLAFTMEVVPGVHGRDVGLVLAGVGRTLATDAVEMLWGRFGAPAASRVQVTLGGQVLRLTEGRESGVGSAAGAEPGTWRRVTGLVVGVARALGVALDGSAARAPRAAAHVPGHADDLRGAVSWQPVGVSPVSGEDLLSRSAFEVPLSRTGAAGRPTWTLWGRGAASGFAGQPEPGFTLAGRLASGYVGVDYRPRPAVLLGLALAHSTGDVEYERTGETDQEVAGDVEVTSVLPYAHWQPRPGLGVWSLLGMGWGTLAIEVTGTGERLRPTALSFLLGAVGGRQALTTLHGIDLAAKADALVSTMTTGGNESVPAARGDAERVRLLLEGRTEWGSAASRVVPRLEVGGPVGSGRRRARGGSGSGRGAGLHAAGVGVAHRRSGAVSGRA